jgi:hypothetical protein
MRRSAFGFAISILSSHFPSFVRRGEGRSRLPAARTDLCMSERSGILVDHGSALPCVTYESILRWKKSRFLNSKRRV